MLKNYKFPILINEHTFKYAGYISHWNSLQSRIFSQTKWQGDLGSTFTTAWNNFNLSRKVTNSNYLSKKNWIVSQIYLPMISPLKYKSESGDHLNFLKGREGLKTQGGGRPPTITTYQYR